MRPQYVMAQLLRQAAASRLAFFSTASKSTLKQDARIPSLPLLTKMGVMARERGLPDQKNTAVIGVQHMLPTTASLFNMFIDNLGVKPENMFFAGKFYSSCGFVEDYIRDRGIQLMKTRRPNEPAEFDKLMERTMKEMWVNFEKHLEKNPEIEKVIVIDEGGHCSKLIPGWLKLEMPCAIVEHTRFGFYSEHYSHGIIPVVDMARSAVKKQLEPSFIIDTILNRINSFINAQNITKKTVFGVVGNGAIGSALAKFLLSDGYKVVVFDEDDQAFYNVKHKNFFRLDNIKDVIYSAEIVFGCTGTDVTKNIKISDIKKPIKLFSCSSQQIEFQSLLTKLLQQDADILTIGGIPFIRSNGDGKIYIAENGCPINFTRTAPIHEMLLTRLLVAGSFIQAVLVAKKPMSVMDELNTNKSTIYSLNPFVQRWIVEHWREVETTNFFTPEELDCFKDLNWISYHSFGEACDNEFLENIFQLAPTDNYQHTFKH